MTYKVPLNILSQPLFVLLLILLCRQDSKMLLLQKLDQILNHLDQQHTQTFTLNLPAFF